MADTEHTPDDEDEVLGALRRNEAAFWLGPLFVLSGATSLVWQTVWARQLHHVFGTSSFAIATVLCAFMGGLALGGAIGSYADRLRRPILWYGAIEAGIGLYALAFPWIVEAITPLYLGFWREFTPSPVSFGAFQAVLIGIALLAPTTAMGATLPLLSRFATERLDAAGDRVGRLYALNTAGAVLGTFLCGFVLLPSIGLWWTTVLTALGNLTLGGLAVLLSQRTGDGELDVKAPATAAGAASPADPELRAPDGSLRAAAHSGLGRVAIASGLAGFAALVYEVAWTRVLVLMLGASVYAFSLMLLAMLTGIALGGRIGGWVGDRLLARFGPDGPIVALALSYLTVGASAYVLQRVWPELPFWYVYLFDAAGGDDSTFAVQIISLGLATLVMTPPAIAMGASFPLSIRVAIGGDKALAAPVGRVYAANTIGGALGAGLAGFVLLPWLAVVGTVAFAAVINALAALVLLVRVPFGRGSAVPRGAVMVGALAAMLLYVFVVPPWNPLLMTAGMYVYAGDLDPDDRDREGILAYTVTRYDLIYYAEGLSTVVTVARNKKTGNIWLSNNGKVDASTSLDMPTQVLVGLLPFQFVEEPDDVLLIGLASGITAGAISQVDTIRDFTVVELEPTMPAAARVFDDYNHHVLDDPRLTLIGNDGRNHVLLQPVGKYDVIVSEPSNPWLTGVSSLFTQEFLRVGRTRLKTHGIWAQWVQMYGMGQEDLRSLLATFASVYPHVQMYATIDYADLVLIGSDVPLKPNPARIQAALDRWPAAQVELEKVKTGTPEDMLAIYVTDRDGLLAIAGNAPINTDDNMRIEYGAPLHLNDNTSEANLTLVADHAEIPLSAYEGDPLGLARLCRAYLRRDDFERSGTCFAYALLRKGNGGPEMQAEVESIAHDIKDERLAAAALKRIYALGDVVCLPLGFEDPFTVEYLQWMDDLVAWSQTEDE